MVTKPTDKRCIPFWVLLFYIIIHKRSTSRTAVGYVLIEYYTKLNQQPIVLNNKLKTNWSTSVYISLQLSYQHVSYWFVLDTGTRTLIHDFSSTNLVMIAPMIIYFMVMGYRKYIWPLKRYLITLIMPNTSIQKLFGLV